MLLDITGWRAEEIDDGVSLLTELGQFGPGGRALYDPRPGDPARWDWGGDRPLSTGTRLGEDTAVAEPSRDAWA